MTRSAAESQLLGRVMVAFEGERLPRWVARRLGDAPVAGMTVFRHHNVRSPGQVRELTEAFQRAGAADAGGGAGGAGTAPLLVAADQEGGQLQALGDAPTHFAGNMALGAVGDDGLAERVGAAIGVEARAMGINVVYAPAVDLASEPANAGLGVRSFGDEPAAVGRLGAVMVRGLQRSGVAATIKHFPGLGQTGTDTHHGLGVVELDRAELEATALAAFRVAIGSGPRLVMSTHVAVPALTGDRALPATLSPAVMRGLLRDELGFAGVTISDALDMRALAQGAAQAVEIIAVVRAGVDLLLCSADRRAQRRIEQALGAAASRGLFEEGDLAASSARIAVLRSWLASAGPAPELSVVGCADHRALSRELAERSVTLVRWAGGAGDAGGPGASTGKAVPASALIPAHGTILAIMPQPTDLTPADTSSTVPPGLGRALRTRFDSVEEVVVGVAPTAGEIAALRARAAGFDAVVVGTIDAIRQPAQFDLVEAVASAGRPTIAVALRTPWDVARYPASVAAVCTYSILPDSLEALAAALAGAIPFAGRLPVAVPGVTPLASAVPA
ncbi:MAG: glycoside hydrolase family 3 N-terminal domain-containing protein [Chloroflexota bacterium]